MPDETNPALTYRSKAETLAQIKAAIEDLEVLVSLLDEEGSDTIAATPALTALTQTVADLANVLEPAEAAATDLASAPEPTADVAPSDPDSASSETSATEAPEAAPPAEAVSEPENPSAEAEFSEPELAAGESEAAEPDTAESATESDDWLEDIQPPTPSATVDRAGQLQELWAWVLQKIRALLPASLGEQLSDQVLTAIVSGVVVFALAIGLLSGSGSEVETKAIAPSQPDTPFAQPTPIFPSEQPTPAPSPVETLPPKPTRPQRLTPEQKLIASIQDQVAQITDQYAEGLIQSIQVDFMAGRLRVLLGSGWYDLEGDRQDQVAAEVLERAKRLDFTKVEMIDADDMLLARNAVVGNKMIIFERESVATEVESTED